MKIQHNNFSKLVSYARKEGHMEKEEKRGKVEEKMRGEKRRKEGKYISDNMLLFSWSLQSISFHLLPIFQIILDVI